MDKAHAYRLNCRLETQQAGVRAIEYGRAFFRVRIVLLTALLTLAMSFWSMQHGPQAEAASPLPSPVQTYYIPLPEASLLNGTFETIHSAAQSDVHTLISIAIAADGTIIYYDHWEPGPLVQIWGDGDQSNGAAPGVGSDADDVLNAGDAIVLENAVAIPRNGAVIRFDGGDKIEASFPIAVTRWRLSRRTRLLVGRGRRSPGYGRLGHRVHCAGGPEHNR